MSKFQTALQQQVPPGVYRFASGALLPTLQQEVDKANWNLYLLDGKKIRDKKTFLEQKKCFDSIAIEAFFLFCNPNFTNFTQLPQLLSARQFIHPQENFITAGLQTRRQLYYKTVYNRFACAPLG